MSSSPITTRHDLRSEYGMACPNCCQADALSVEITCTATLTIDGTEDCGDHYWDASSSCHCEECDHHGSVAEFRAAGEKAVRS